MYFQVLSSNDNEEIVFSAIPSLILNPVPASHKWVGKQYARPSDTKGVWIKRVKDVRDQIDVAKGKYCNVAISLILLEFFLIPNIFYRTKDTKNFTDQSKENKIKIKY